MEKQIDQAQMLKNIHFWGNQYTNLKEDIQTIQDAYLETLKMYRSPLLPMIKKNAQNQLQISYCDETYLFDFLVIKDSTDKFLICGQMYRQKRSVNVVPVEELYVPIGNAIYFDNDHSYKRQDKLFEVKERFPFNAIDDIILEVLSHNFDERVF